MTDRARRLLFPSELAMWQPFGVDWPFASFRLALYYDEIRYADPSPPFEAIALLTRGCHVSTEEYKKALTRATAVKSLTLDDLIEVRAPPVRISERWDGATTPWILANELKFAGEHAFDILVPYDLLDDSCAYLLEDVETLTRLKRTHLKWEVLNYLLDREVPGFAVDLKAHPPTLAVSRPAIASFVDEVTQAEAGYELTKPTKENLDRTFAERRRILDNLAGTHRLGRLTPSAEEVLTAITSEVAGSVIPFAGELLSGLKRLMTARAVRRERLGAVIALSAIRATCASRPSPVSACKIGELSIPELQSADPFSLFGDLCLAHQVAYLNGRKIRHLHGTPLVLFMKQTDCGTR